MKKILIIVFCLVSLKGLSQTPPGYTKINARYAWTAGTFDSGLHMPRYSVPPNTIPMRVGVPTYAGNLGLDTALHQPWYYSGNLWRQFGTVYNITLGWGLQGTNPLTTTGSIRADTSSMFTNLFTTLSLTTTGTGAATWNSGTRILNIPTPSLTTYYNSNIGSGFRWVVPNTNNIKTTFVTSPVTIDSTTNANALTFGLDTASGRWRSENYYNTVYVPVGRTLTAGYGLSGGGNLSANRTFTLDSATVFPQVIGTIALSTTGSGAASWNTTTRRLNIPVPVSSVGAGYGISGGTITTTGTHSFDSATVFPQIFGTLALTTTGTGAASYNSTTRILNVPTPSTAYVTSVGLALPSEFNITNSPVTNTGTLTGAWANQTAFTVFRRASGTGVPSFGAIDTTYIADFWSKTRSLFSAGVGLSYANGVFTNTGDLSTTNELQTIANTSDATSHTVTLSNSGGTVQLIEGANVTLTTGGTSSAGTVTIAAANQRFGVSGEDATATQTRAFNTNANPFSISGTDGIGLTKVELGVTEGEVRIQARPAALSGAQQGTFINLDGAAAVMQATTPSVDESTDVTAEDGTGAQLRATSIADNTWQSQINVRKDSISIFPKSGKLNIDSLRSWTAIADSAYKRIMTWDERNGRWEYFDGYFPTNTGVQTLANTSDATSHTVTLSGGSTSVQLIEGTGVSLTTGGSGASGTVTINNTGIIGFTDNNGFDGTVTSNFLSLTTTLTAGSVFFAGAAGAINEDNDDLYFDNTNDRFAIGHNSPSYTFDTRKSVAGERVGYFYNSSGTGQGLFVKVNNDDDYDILNLQSSVATVFNVQANGSVAFMGDYGTVGYYLRSTGTGTPPTWTVLPDASSTNEIQTFTSTSDATSFTWTLASGGSLKLIEGDGIDFTIGGTSADPTVTITGHAH